MRLFTKQVLNDGLYAGLIGYATVIVVMAALNVARRTLPDGAVLLLRREFARVAHG